MSNELDRQSIQQRFRRRFAFNTHAVISIIGIVLLILAGLDTRRYLIAAPGTPPYYYIFAGLNSIPFLLAIVMGTALALHSSFYRNQEAIERGETDQSSRNKRRRRTLFTMHTLLAIAPSLASWLVSMDVQRILLGVDSTGRQVIEQWTPLTFEFSVIPLIIFLLLLPHAIRLLYVEMLERTMNREAERAEQQKLKNEQQDTQWSVGDDGELFLQNELEQIPLKRKN